MKFGLITKNAMMYGLASAILFAGVFVLLHLSGGFVSDVYLGAIAGVVSGSIIALVVGVAEQELLRKKAVAGFAAWSGSNPFIGSLAGALITTGVIIAMVQLIGCGNRPETPVIFGLSLCCLIGVPLGVMIGLPIGASWRLR